MTLSLLHIKKPKILINGSNSSGSGSTIDALGLKVLENMDRYNQN